MIFQDKRILIIGGSGSVGKAVTKQLLLNHDPYEIVIFSRDEYKQWSMELELKKGNFDLTKIKFILGDIKDYNAIERAMQKVDIVIHLAAIKHINKCEENPVEATKINVLGSTNIIEAALKMKPSKVIAMSTDKACNPINVYGKTKSLMEDIFTASNNHLSKGNTIFSCVRCGNILDSNGSVTEIFRQQAIKDKKVKITNPKMTRFWITLNDISTFILESLKVMVGGEIFIPKMGSSTIETLANVFSCEKEIIGAKAGERTHEILISKEESSYCYDNEDFYIVSKNINKGIEDFEYRSDDSLNQLTTEDLREMLNL